LDGLATKMPHLRCWAAAFAVAKGGGESARGAVLQRGVFRLILGWVKKRQRPWAVTGFWFGEGAKSGGVIRSAKPGPKEEDHSVNQTSGCSRVAEHGIITTAPDFAQSRLHIKRLAFL
jgi:hypothetical protein